MANFSNKMANFSKNGKFGKKWQNLANHLPNYLSKMANFENQPENESGFENEILGLANLANDQQNLANFGKQIENQCEKCNKIFSSKYTLKKHMETNKKCALLELKCTSERCNFITHQKDEYQSHIEDCQHVKIDEMIQSIISEKDNQILELQSLLAQKDAYIKEQDIEMEKKDNILLELDEKMNDLTKEVECIKVEKSCIEKENQRLTILLEKMMDKPVITNNTMNTTNIKGNQLIQNVLASSDVYSKQTNSERIRSIPHKIIEKHFWLGQKGIARFCLNYIVKSADADGAEKMILCCTDPSRKRFKYFNASNKIVEDIEARHFTDLISIPIKTVCREVYDNIIKKIEEDKKETTDIFDLDLLETRISIAQQKFLEINNIGDNQRNSEYKNELSILLNV
jgi:hypothetical protein